MYFTAFHEQNRSRLMVHCQASKTRLQFKGNLEVTCTNNGDDCRQLLGILFTVYITLIISHLYNYDAVMILICYRLNTPGERSAHGWPTIVRPQIFMEIES